MTTPIHPIGTTVRVRDDARSRHAGETGTVVKRIDIDIPGEPYPVLVHFAYGSTALYADADLEAVDGVPHGLLLDVEPGPPIDWEQAATSHMRHIRELAAERDAAQASRDRLRAYIGSLESLFAPTMANDARIDGLRLGLQDGDLFESAMKGGAA